MRAGDKREGEKHQTYLGDGIYFSDDGFYFWLRVDRENGIHEIALEPEVIDQLVKLREKICS